MELVILMAGIVYGLIIGLIPAAGATTGLITLFGFIPYFVGDPYLGVIFCVAVVASSTTGDSFSGVLLGIPGANSAAATMVDGFPMAKNGEATRALSAAITSSTANGLFWGSLTFLFLPFYTQVVMYMGIPELWALVLLAFVTVGFVSTRKYVRSTLAIVLGVIIGLVGVDVNNVPRFTMGWRYLEDGVQILPFVAGLFAIPELWDGWFKRKATTSVKAVHGSWKDVTQGFKDTIVELPKFVDKDLPEGARPISAWADWKALEPSGMDENLVKVLEYMKTRQLYIDDYNFHWTPKLGYKDRLIVPFYHKEYDSDRRVVGWTARKVNGGNPKYMSEQQPGYVFNLDAQNYQRIFCIVVEGPFDAISVDGVALLGSEVKDQQALTINALNKKVILVPDRDDNGYKLMEQAIELGWSVSMPDWDEDVKM